MVELVVRVTLSLAAVLGLFWLVARGASRRMAGASRGVVRVRGRQALSRTSSVAVVEVGDRVLVLGVSDGGVRLLTELDPEEVADPAAAEDARPDPATGPATDPATGPSAVTGSPLSGSLLAPATWRQAWSAATSRLGSDA
ncbi:MAG: FliO/MopB family protein [Nocardioidaceae bacterium]